MAAAAGFGNWERAADRIPSTDKLFRSGSPHYSGADNHSLDKKAIDFLKTSGIKHVVSLNSKAVTNTEIKEKLVAAGIAYTPLPVADFNAPTEEQLSTGNEAYKKYRDGTLVWCGYGHGRTGTMITALQIYAIKNTTSPEILGHEHYRNNHVEQFNPSTKISTGQFEVLDVLQKRST